MAFQPLGAVHPLPGPGDDSGGIVLENGGHRRNLQRLGAGQGRGHGVLGRDSKLRLPGGTEGGGPVLRGLNDADLQSGLLKITQRLGGVEPGVIGVGRPLQADGQLILRFLPPSPAGCEHQNKRQNSRQKL